ncbi:hypothetical protein IB352_004117 [Escherichia coli]|nr:hypothetical protein [Escherichia coli]
MQKKTASSRNGGWRRKSQWGKQKEMLSYISYFLMKTVLIVNMSGRVFSEQKIHQQVLLS